MLKFNIDVDTFTRGVLASIRRCRSIFYRGGKIVRVIARIIVMKKQNFFFLGTKSKSIERYFMICSHLSLYADMTISFLEVAHGRAFYRLVTAHRRWRVFFLPVTAFRAGIRARGERDNDPVLTLINGGPAPVIIPGMLRERIG